MTKTIFFHALTAFTALFLTGCDDDFKKSAFETYGEGIYIINEGAFGQNNGSISFYDIDNDTVINNIFEAANNNRPIGDVVQSFTLVNGNTGYIVVNGSSKIEIVNASTFTTITDPIVVKYPRYFTKVDADKGYISAGSMQGFIYIVDLQSNSVTDSIKVGYGPEVMLKKNNSVFVVNSGGWSVDSTISIINTVTDEVSDTIITGKVPVDMAFDASGYLWVICKGYALYDWNPPYNLIEETDALLMKIDTETRQVIWQDIIGSAGDFIFSYPKLSVSADGETIFCLLPDGVYKLSAELPALPSSAFISGTFYGLEVNPSDDNIFVFESSFTGAGKMVIYNDEGSEIKNFTVGIAPNGAVFNLY